MHYLFCTSEHIHWTIRLEVNLLIAIINMSSVDQSAGDTVCLTLHVKSHSSIKDNVCGGSRRNYSHTIEPSCEGSALSKENHPLYTCWKAVSQDLGEKERLIHLDDTTSATAYVKDFCNDYNTEDKSRGSFIDNSHSQKIPEIMKRLQLKFSDESAPAAAAAVAKAESLVLSCSRSLKGDHGW